MNQQIKAIVGLGNPGPRFFFTRHNSGFLVLDALAQRYNAQWRQRDNYLYTTISTNDHSIMLIKPQTFMNQSGDIFTALKKQNIRKENILIIHDELELPFGTIKVKFDGSAKGHNGLKSIIQAIGKDFLRLRFGIGRPQNKNDVPEYVLENFTDKHALTTTIDKAVNTLLNYLETSNAKGNSDG